MQFYGVVLVIASVLCVSVALPRGRWGSQLALAKRAEEVPAILPFGMGGFSEEDYPEVERRLAFAPDPSTYYYRPYFRSSLAKKKDTAATPATDIKNAAGRKFQTQGWKR